MLSLLVFIIYGCKSVVSDEIYSYVKYLETYRLRGMSENFFIEIIIGKNDNVPFCEILFLPAKIGIDVDKVKCIYGSNTVHANFDSLTGKYRATIDYDKVHTAIFYDAGGGREVVELVQLTQECPAEELLQKAYEHFEQRFSENKTDASLQRIEIKILADMSGNAFFYIVFLSKNDLCAILFDINTLNIIADYSH